MRDTTGIQGHLTLFRMKNLAPNWLHFSSSYFFNYFRQGYQNFVFKDYIKSIAPEHKELKKIKELKKQNLNKSLKKIMN